MYKLPGIKENWDRKVPLFRGKLYRMMDSAKPQQVNVPESVSRGVTPMIVTPGIIQPQARSGFTPSLSLPKIQNIQTEVNSDSSLVDAAKKYIGTPYVWGGDSAEEGGFDCSGFVYNALRDAGYQMGRTTAEGYRGYGSVVSKDEMQPGDLLFFGKNGRASHIGIYAGNGQMIHSSGGQKNTKSNPGKGVNIANVSSRSDFIEARRV